mgnify:CR=1 FL=1
MTEFFVDFYFIFNSSGNTSGFDISSQQHCVQILASRGGGGQGATLLPV